MRKITRGECPQVLVEKGAKWTERFVASGDWHGWPQYEKRKLNHILLDEGLRTQTRDHCSYCDSTPISPPGTETIDHFRPKSGPHARPDLAFDWDNLFYCCNFCQENKRDRFDEALLKPDEADYEFLRYFQWEFDTGRLMPSEIADDDERHRAMKTIELLQLNLKHPAHRVKRLTSISDAPECLDDEPYRDFLEFAFP